MRRHQGEKRKAECGTSRSRSGFTLVELLIVMMIIGILASLGVAVWAGAIEQAREQRTRSIITKLDQLIMEHYESYRTRPVPVRIPRTFDGITITPRMAAQIRLYALRELMRLELPDRISDLCTAAELTDISGDSTLNAVANRNDASRVTLNKVTGLTGSTVAANTSILSSIPSLPRSYKRRIAMAIAANGGWTTANEGAECLYLIISSMHDGDKNAIDYFASGEIGDVDGDGMKEILDAWGTPIQFLRWAPGYCEQAGVDGQWGIAGTDDDLDGLVDNATEAGAVNSDDVNQTSPPPFPLTTIPITRQTRNYAKAPDPFDPVKVDPRWNASPPALGRPYALIPLIFSAGRDKQYDINAGTIIYANFINDPYFSATPQIGSPYDTNGDGVIDIADNITNHDLITP